MNTVNTWNNWRSVFRFLTSPLGVLAILLAGALLLAGPLTPALAADPNPLTGNTSVPMQANKNGSLAVSGAAAIKVQPDIATIHVGVETFASSPRESKRLNSDLVRAIKAQVTAAGVAEKDIRALYLAQYSPDSNHKGGIP